MSSVGGAERRDGGMCRGGSREGGREGGGEALREGDDLRSMTSWRGPGRSRSGRCWPWRAGRRRGPSRRRGIRGRRRRPWRWRPGRRPAGSDSQSRDCQSRDTWSARGRFRRSVRHRRSRCRATCRRRRRRLRPLSSKKSTCWDRETRRAPRRGASLRPFAAAAPACARAPPSFDASPPCPPSSPVSPPPSARRPPARGPATAASRRPRAARAARGG
mmetsp:Transcript_21416/g.67227  ORF Transcript_21416/g.67227 Transcript_21416/m.67227 type:complete len:217 (+) Transcript_21416:207-857(+)